jgi:hypothetical protein
MDEKSNNLSETRNELEFLRGWIKGAIEGLNEVDEAIATKILKKCGEICLRSWTRMAGLDKKKYDLDTLISKINQMPECSWRREGNTIYEVVSVGKCICPLLTWGILEQPNPKQCLCCCQNWYKTLFQEVAGVYEEKYELIESIALGGSKCVFRHYLRLT